MSAWLGIRPLGQSAGEEYPKVFPHDIKNEVRYESRIIKCTAVWCSIVQCCIQSSTVLLIQKYDRPTAYPFHCLVLQPLG